MAPSRPGDNRIRRPRHRPGRSASAARRDLVRSDARRDQRELADAFRLAPHIERGEIRAGAMREQVHPVEAQVLAQGVHVIDEPVAAAGSGVLRYRRLAGPPGNLQQHEQRRWLSCSAASADRMVAHSESISAVTKMTDGTEIMIVVIWKKPATFAPMPVIYM